MISALTAAMPAMTKNLALELAPVRVNLIAAGFVDTPLSAEILGDQLEARRNQLRKSLHSFTQRAWRSVDMTRSSVGQMLTIAVGLAVVGGWAIAAQDKYTLRVPNGLAFSEFKGYEAWQVVSISQDGPLVAAILANPVMIKAYQSGVPGNG